MNGGLSCFSPGDHMLSVGQARQAVLELVKAPLASERVALAEAHGRVLSEPVFASFDVPGHTNAAMDGIALAWSQVAEKGQHCDAETADRGWQWRRVGEALAGRPFVGDVDAGDCVAITTGAPLPAGTDTVIMQEQVEAQGDLLTICNSQRVRTGQNVRQAGEDIARGAMALAAGTRLDAAALGMLASLGLAEIAVRRRARVAIFSTGDEVTAPGEPRGEAAIYDSNRFSLMGLLREQGVEVMDLGIIADDRQALIAGLRRAASEVDLVISSGGVSVGQSDHTRAALEQLGQLVMWRIALRPGRPMACGLLTEREVPFLGLPGNPVACMVTALCFMIPMLRVMQGRESSTETWQGVAESHFKSRAGRTEFCRGAYRIDEQGNLRVVKTGEQGSGILSSMVAANCLVELSEQSSGAGPGDMVTIHPLSIFA